MYHTLKSFEYFEPQTVEKAVQILSGYGDKAKVLAGGVDLVTRMRLRQIKPKYVVSILRIPGLDYIKSDGAGLRIGALTTLRSLELSSAVHKDYIVLHEAVHQIASIQVKTMATVVGNLCVATPASDIVTALFSLGAELKIVCPSGERTVPIEKFFTGVNRTIMQPGEIVTEVLLPPLPIGSGTAFLNLVRTAPDIAKVIVAVAITITNDIIKDARIALGSVTPTVIRAGKAEEVLKGKKFEPGIIKKAAEVAAGETKPISDVRSTAEYRKEMSRVLCSQAIEKALERARVNTLQGS